MLHRETRRVELTKFSIVLIHQGMNRHSSTSTMPGKKLRWLFEANQKKHILSALVTRDGFLPSYPSESWRTVNSGQLAK